MQAYVIHQAGGPENLVRAKLPTPRAGPGLVIIQIKAFGLNRAEWFTRRGDSPSVIFPRVLGIECVGVVSESHNPNFPVGQKVAALMGGMGREFDGSYAEFVRVPESIVIPFESELPWEILGALPEMLQTTHGSLFQGLGIERGQSLLIRGGTSSIGLCALEIATQYGLKVYTTTRSAEKVKLLEERGASKVYLETPELSRELRMQIPEGVDRVLELIGASSLLDSLKLLKRGGVACMTGILGGQWELAKFTPMGDIPSTVKLTSYSGEGSDLPPEAFQTYLSDIANKKMSLPTIRSFPFAQLQEAHHLMDANQANGKIVILVGEGQV